MKSFYLKKIKVLNIKVVGPWVRDIFLVTLIRCLVILVLITSIIFYINFNTVLIVDSSNCNIASAIEDSNALKIFPASDSLRMDGDIPPEMNPEVGSS